MGYVLNKIDKKLLDDLREKWIVQASGFGEIADYILGDVDRIISWCESNINGEGDLCLWLLYDDESNNPRAIVEMTDARRSKDPSFKFLKLHLEPDLVLDYKENIDQEDISEVFKILVFSLMHSFKAAIEHGAKKLKIFARTQAMDSLFDAILINNESLGSGTKSYRQGKWLIIEVGR